MRSINFHKIQSILIYSLITLLPTQLVYHYWPESSLLVGRSIDYLSLQIYLTDIFVVLILLTQLPTLLPKLTKAKLLFIFPLKYIFVSIFFIFLIIQTTWATFPITHLYLTSKLISFFLLVLVIRNHHLNKKIIFNIFLFQLFAICLIASIQFIQGHSINGFAYWLGERRFNLNTPGISSQQLFGKLRLRPYSIFSHPNTLSGYIVVTLVWLISWFHVIIKKLLNFCVLLLTLWVVLITNSLAVFLSLVCVAIIHSLIKIYPEKIKIYPFLIFSFLIPLVMVRLNNYVDIESLSLRNHLFITHLSLIKSNILTGVGFHGFLSFITNSSKYSLKVLTIQPVHNVIWFIIGSFGLVGVSLVLLLPLNLQSNQIKYTSLKSFFTSSYSQFKFVYSQPISIHTLPFLIILITSTFDHYWITQQQTLLLVVVLLALHLQWEKS